MTQLAQIGDQSLVNHLSGVAAPVASVGSSPPTWFPGLYWYNTTASAFEGWNGTAWSTGAFGLRYLALLTADPVLGGAVNISDTGFVELTTTGYLRQSVAFNQASSSYPSQASNTSLITFGPMSISMVVPIQWVALVTTGPTGEPSNEAGFFLASWQLVAPVQVDASQSIQIGIGQLVIQGQ